MIDCQDAKLKEQQFISRLRENMAFFAPAARMDESDNLSELRKLTGGKMLKSELAENYPLGRALSLIINTSKGLFAKDKSVIVTGRVTLHLNSFIESRADNQPVTLTELNTILSNESGTAGRLKYELILGLYSPTGFAEDAKTYIVNEPPGSGYASNTVLPVLIGPEITQLCRDVKNQRLAWYVNIFCGLTLAERQTICTEQIKRQILVNEFANLEKIAADNALALEFVKKIAQQMSKEDKKLKLTTVSGVGIVLKRRI